jgi:arylsulfatase
MLVHRFTASSFLSLFLAVCIAASAAEPAKRPNILLILADDLGYSDLGCYGGEIPTPNLDRLAAEGLRFSQFYNSARCCPSRAALLTGLYPHQAGVGDMVDNYALAVRNQLASPAYTDHLSSRTPTVAELLGAAGYRTGMAGKWHLGYRPEEWPVARGFQSSLVQIDGAMNYWGYGIQHNTPPKTLAEPPMAHNAESFSPPREGWLSTDAYADFAASFIREQGAGGQPFFFYLAFNAPHWPLQAPTEDIEAQRRRYAAGYDAIRSARLDRLKTLGLIPQSTTLAPRPQKIPAWEEAAEEQRTDWREKMAIYAAQITRMDAGIGRVLDALRERGELGRTLVVFLSDNGGAAENPNRTMPGAILGSRDSYFGYDLPGAHVSSAPFRLHKIFTHEGGIAAPCIVRWPDAVQRGGTITSEPAHLIDLLPTFLHAAESQLPPQWHEQPTSPLEGCDLSPVLAGGSLPERLLFWEHEGHRAVRSGQWKLVARRGNPWELYDLSTDRTELNNLAGTEPERVAALTHEYEVWAKRCGVQPWPAVQAKN